MPVGGSGIIENAAESEVRNSFSPLGTTWPVAARIE
jgi:hypothetical protein